MDSAPLPDAGGEAAQILHALRHALADPLSSAALKLDLVERRFLSPSGADPAWVLERVHALQADVGAATRLLGLLPRLAAIADERATSTSLRDVCLVAGVPLPEAAGAVPRLMLRRASLADAIRSVASFATGHDAAPPMGHEELEHDRVTLSLEGTRRTAEGRPARLLDLPHGSEDAEALFVARAVALADGGRLELTERSGSVVATFSWPLQPGGEYGREGAG